MALAAAIIGGLISSDPEWGKELRCNFFPKIQLICPPKKIAAPGNLPDKELPPDASTRRPDGGTGLSPTAGPPAAPPPATSPSPTPPIARPAPSPPTIPAPPSMRPSPTETCVVRGYIIEQPVVVKNGSRICSADGETRATIKEVTTYSISFVLSKGGGSFTCKKTESCSFGTEGPDFRISAVDSNQTTGERTALLVRN